MASDSTVYYTALDRSESPATDSSGQQLCRNEESVYSPKSMARSKRLRQLLVLLLLVLLLLILVILVIVVTVMLHKAKSASAASGSDSNSSSGSSTVQPVERHSTNVLALTRLLTYGQVIGVEEGNIYVYRGIPYAVPPVKELRWKPPVPLTADNADSQGPYEAKSFQSPCFQYNAYTDAMIGSEDCLYLNVWTPSLSPTALLNVMVFIHGGGLQTAGHLFGHDLLTGSGNEEGMTPTPELVTSMNMVFVTFNYRLGPLGFLALNLSSNEGGDLRGNYGLMDQNAVLRWVQNNIQQFGGDPGKVTLYGLGGGATCGLVHFTNQQSDGLFHRLWLASPAPFTNNTLTEVYTQNQQWLRDSGLCRDASSNAELYSCLYSLDPEDLTQLIPDQYWDKTHLLDFPSPDERMIKLIAIDGVFLKIGAIAALQASKVMKIPILIGSVAQESDTWLTPTAVPQWTWDDYSSYLTDVIGPFQVNNKHLDYQVLANYPHHIEPQVQYTSLISDIRGICPLNFLAHLIAFTNTTVYRYIATFGYADLPLDKCVEPRVNNSATPNGDTPILDDPGQHRRRREIDEDGVTFAAGFKYAYHGIDIMHLVQGMQGISPNRTLIMRGLVREFATSGRVSGWSTYPGRTMLVASYQQTLLCYHRDQCDMWNGIGMVPRYTWSL